MHPATQFGQLNAGPSERQLSRSTVSCRTIASSHVTLLKAKSPVAEKTRRSAFGSFLRFLVRCRGWRRVRYAPAQRPRPVLLAVGGHRPTLPSPAHPAPAPWPAPALRQASAVPCARAAPAHHRSKNIWTSARRQSTSNEPQPGTASCLMRRILDPLFRSSATAPTRGAASFRDRRSSHA